MRVYQLRESCEFYLIAGEHVRIVISEKDYSILCSNAEGLLVRKFADIGNVFLVYKDNKAFICSASTAMGSLLMSSELESRMMICGLIASHIIQYCYAEGRTLAR